MACLSQSFIQRVNVKKPLHISSARAMQNLGYDQIFVAVEILACLLGH